MTGTLLTRRKRNDLHVRGLVVGGDHALLSQPRGWALKLDFCHLCHPLWGLTLNTHLFVPAWTDSRWSSWMKSFVWLISPSHAQVTQWNLALSHWIIDSIFYTPTSRRSACHWWRMVVTLQGTRTWWPETNWIAWKTALSFATWVTPTPRSMW